LGSLMRGADPQQLAYLTCTQLAERHRPHVGGVSTWKPTSPPIRSNWISASLPSGRTARTAAASAPRRRWRRERYSSSENFGTTLILEPGTTYRGAWKNTIERRINVRAGGGPWKARSVPLLRTTGSTTAPKIRVLIEGVPSSGRVNGARSTTTALRSTRTMFARVLPGNAGTRCWMRRNRRRLKIDDVAIPT